MQQKRSKKTLKKSHWPLPLVASVPSVLAPNVVHAACCYFVPTSIVSSKNKLVTTYDPANSVETFWDEAEHVSLICVMEIAIFNSRYYMAKTHGFVHHEVLLVKSVASPWNSNGPPLLFHCFIGTSKSADVFEAIVIILSLIFCGSQILILEFQYISIEIPNTSKSLKKGSLISKNNGRQNSKYRKHHVHLPTEVNDWLQELASVEADALRSLSPGKAPVFGSSHGMSWETITWLVEGCIRQ